MKQKEFKEKMPGCAEFVEELVRAFGKDIVHGQVRAGLEGQPTFWARENGHEIGTRDTSTTRRIVWDPVTGLARDEEIKRD